jgi:hypothetical protein
MKLCIILFLASAIASQATTIGSHDQTYRGSAQYPTYFGPETETLSIVEGCTGGNTRCDVVANLFSATISSEMIGEAQTFSVDPSVMSLLNDGHHRFYGMMSNPDGGRGGYFDSIDYFGVDPSQYSITGFNVTVNTFSQFSRAMGPYYTGSETDTDFTIDMMGDPVPEPATTVPILVACITGLTYAAAKRLRRQRSH